jgi:hypothetical protein
MFDIHAVAAVALVGVGVIVGALAIFVLGMHREDRARNLGRPSPGRITSRARAVTSAYVGTPLAANADQRHSPWPDRAGRPGHRCERGE